MTRQTFAVVRQDNGPRNPHTGVVSTTPPTRQPATRLTERIDDSVSIQDLLPLGIHTRSWMSSPVIIVRETEAR